MVSGGAMGSIVSRRVFKILTVETPISNATVAESSSNSRKQGHPYMRSPIQPNEPTNKQCIIRYLLRYVDRPGDLQTSLSGCQSDFVLLESHAPRVEKTGKPDSFGF